MRILVSLLGTDPVVDVEDYQQKRVMMLAWVISLELFLLVAGMVFRKK